VHVIVQTPLAQRNGSHVATDIVLVQAPAPSHVSELTFEPTHTFAPHAVPEGASVDPAHDVRVLPSQTGAAHTVAPAAHGVRAPCGAPATATHAPCAPFASHASHSPVHADAQQKPSTQKPLVHAVAFEHVRPSGCFFAHRLLLQ
jgi:hypothetical protein